VVEYSQYTTSDISVTTCKMVAVVHRRPCLQHLACCSVNSRHIGLELRFLPTPPAFDDPLRGGGSRRKIAIPFSIEKLEWCGCPTEKKFEYIFIRFDRIHERDRQTDRQTPHDGIGCACASHRTAKTKLIRMTSSIKRLGDNAICSNQV